MEIDLKEEEEEEEVPQNRPPIFHGTPEQISILMSEIEALLQKNATREITQQEVSNSPGFFSKLFTVPKPNKEWRPCLDLRPFNSLSQNNRFKMESLSQALDLIREGMFFSKIDLKDAYLHIPIHKNYQKYLRFMFQRRYYQFKVLPFGLNSAPRVYTKIFRAVIDFLRERGILLIFYLDDILIMSPSSRKLAEEIIPLVEETIIGAGFTINLKKSSLIPSQTVQFLGFIIDSNEMKVFITREKIMEAEKESNTFLFLEGSYRFSHLAMQDAFTY